MGGKNDTAPTTYTAKYLGGHSAFPRSKSVHLVITSKHIEIPEMKLIIPLKRVDIVHLVKEEKTATRLLNFQWRKNKKFLMLTYEDKAGFEESMVFDVNEPEEANKAIHSAKQLLPP